MLVRNVPGDVIRDQLTGVGYVSADQLDKIRAQMGLGVPVPVQYVRWMGGTVIIDPPAGTLC